MVVNWFHRSLLGILLISFIVVLGGSIELLRTQTIASKNAPDQMLLFGIVFCLLLFLLISKCFHWLNTKNDRSCLVFSIIVIILIFGLMTTISFSARVSQFVDAYDDLDAAIYLRDHSELAEDLPYIKLVGSFGNNYPFILLETFLMKTMQWMSIVDCIVVLTRLNVIILITTVIISWLIVKETRGIKAAAKSVFIWMLNPYLYLLVNWTYTMIYSLPFMMGMLYVAIRLRKTNKNTCGIVLSILEGVLISVGFLIRATSIFPLIALIIIWFPSFLKHRISKKRIVQILCVICVMILVFCFINIQTNRFLGNIKHMKLPLSFWLLMGSHGGGTWYGPDMEAVLAVQDPGERNKFALEQAVTNYKEQGIDGTINLLCRKLNEVWANGGFFYWQPSTSESNSFAELYLGSGARNELLKVYCQIFRVFMIIGFILAVIVCILKRRIPEIIMVLMIIIFGCVVFHSIWEANGRYSIPFILPMLTAVGYGVSEIQKYADDKALFIRKQKRVLGIAFIGLLIIACMNLNLLLKEETDLKFYRISSTRQDRVIVPIESHGFVQLEQDFYTEKPFNTLSFSASIPQGIKHDECSEYELIILNDEKEALLSTRISPDQINGSRLQVAFDTISGYSHYYICLHKIDQEKDSILFYTHDTYGVDEYRGELIVDNEVAKNDIKVDVLLELNSATLLSNKIRISFLLFIFAMGITTVAIPVSNREKRTQDTVYKRAK